MKTIEGRVTISKPNHSDGSRQIAITVEDHLASVRFLRLHLSLEQFAEALTGLGNVPCSMEIGFLDVVGTRRLSRHYSIIADVDSDIRYGGRDGKQREFVESVFEQAEKELVADGWILDSSLNSQGSVVNLGGGRTRFNMRITKFADVDAPIPDDLETPLVREV